MESEEDRGKDKMDPFVYHLDTGVSITTALLSGLGPDIGRFGN